MNNCKYNWHTTLFNRIMCHYDVAAPTHEVLTLLQLALSLNEEQSNQMSYSGRPPMRQHIIYIWPVGRSVYFILSLW